MEKPIRIGFLVGLAALLTSCGWRNQADFDVLRLDRIDEPGLAKHVSTTDNGIRSRFVIAVPIDQDGKKLGKKVFAKVEARIYQSPRESSPEYYRVSPGSPLWVSPTKNKNWLQVRMSGGRSGYVRANQTTAEIELALAQERIADQQRLTPKPRPDSEPDIGDGKSGNSNERDAALNEAIGNAQSAFAAADEDFDRLRAEITGFQGPSTEWPAVKESVLELLNTFQNEFAEVSNAIQPLTAMSAKLNANERTAFQSIVIHQGEVADSIQTIRNTLNQMAEGSDWTPHIATLGENMTSLSGAMDGLRINLARLG